MVAVVRRTAMAVMKRWPWLEPVRSGSKQWWASRPGEDSEEGVGSGLDLGFGLSIWMANRRRGRWAAGGKEDGMHGDGRLGGR